MNQPPKVKVYVEGRYKKLVRDLPQTVFFCPDCKGHPRRRKGCERCEGFGKLTRDSVQELVGWVLGSAFKTRKNKFHGAGREDVDVRMLGDGRPFVLELIHPKNHEVDLAELEAEINRRNEGRLEILGLHWSEKPRIRVLKETPHAKEYQALVATESEPDLSGLEEVIGQRITISQQTPSRVAHRRADKVRERWIEVRSFEPTETENRWMLTMRTQHGTYVKEAITGENGSTVPSISQLTGVPCRCVELDVTRILDEEGSAVETRRKASAVFGEGV